MKKHQILLVITAALSASGTANAFDGASSQPSWADVDVSNVPFGPHTANNAGIAINSSGLSNFVDFIGLAGFSSNSSSNVDWNQDGTADGTKTVHELNFPYTGAPSSHDALGVFAFAQVGGDDIWFGEWSAYGTSDETRTVYYYGDHDDSAITATGTDVKYNIVGINNYDPASSGNLLSGQFTANFNASTLSGSMSNGSLSVNIGTATINPNATISGSGASAAVSGIPVALAGSVSGQFYNNQADLAGMVDFSGTQYDTAYGGSQVTP